MNNFCRSILVALYRAEDLKKSKERLDKVLSEDDGCIARFLTDEDSHKFGKVFEAIFDYYRSTGLLIPIEDLYVRDIGLDDKDLLWLQISPVVSDEMFDNYISEISAAFLKEEVLERLDDFKKAVLEFDVSVESYQKSVSKLFSELEAIAAKFAAKLPHNEEIVSLVDSLTAVLSELKANPLIDDEDSGIGEEISFGFSQIDDAVGRLFPGDLGVIVGETGVGKTFLVTEIARRNFLSGKDIVFVTTEMNNKHVTSRLLGLHAGINPRWIKEKEISTFGVEKLEKAADHLKSVPSEFVILEGKSSVAVTSIISAIDAFKPSLVVVDGVYMVRSPNVSSNTPLWERVLTTIQTLKQAAMDAGIPIICTTQYSKKGKKYGAEGVGYTMEIPRIASVLLSFEAVDATEVGDLSYPAKLLRRLKVLKGRDGGEGAEFLIVYDPAKGLISEFGSNKISFESDSGSGLDGLL